MELGGTKSTDGVSGVLPARPLDKTRQVNTRMEVKETKRGKSLSQRSASCRDHVAPGSSTSLEAHSLKNFTIPKIHRAAEKVYLSSCHTNRREYSSISHTLSQCRLDLSCELQSSWQFGETKLVHNEYLEKKFSAKRSEMREHGRRGRELEEHYCFLALSHSAVSRMYQSGLCTRESTLKALGNPLLGVYLFRHADVALSYARSRKHHVDNLMIFKVLYGKVKKIQPVMDKSKACLDPSPNFDCHMSRLIPTAKDIIEQQAVGSAVYLYEYNTLSKPVDKPRQCLPYATITVKFLGQKAESGPTITSLRFLSAGFPKWSEKRGSLNNCTIAKRIGKGKDATVIYEHFPKPTDSSAQDSCSCNAEMNPDISSPCGSVQNNSFFAVDTPDSQNDYNLTENHNLSQVQTIEANPPLLASVGATQNVNGDLLINLNYLEKFFNTLSAAVTFPNSVGTSTVTTSKLIKDPRLLRRGVPHDQANPESGSQETLPLESREEYPDSQMNSLPSLPMAAALPPGAIPGEPMALNLGSPHPEGLSHDAALKGVLSQNCDCRAIHEVVMDDPKEDQHHTDLQVPLPYASKEVIPEHDNREYIDKEMDSSSEMNKILLPVKKQARGKCISEMNHFPRKGMPMDTNSESLSNLVSQESQPDDLKIVHEILQPSSPGLLQVQKETRNKYNQGTQNVKSLNTDTENHSQQGKNKYCKKKENYDSTHGEKSSSRECCVSYEKHKVLILSHQDSNDCKKPRNQGTVTIPMRPSTSREQERKHIPWKSENSYPVLSTQKSSKNCLEEWLKCERMYIDKYFSKPPKVTELKMESLHLTPISMKANVSQEMDIIVQTKEKPNDLINLALDTEVSHSKVIRDGSEKYLGVSEGNENGLLSPEDPHKDGKMDVCLAEEADQSQVCPMFCDPVFGDDNIAFPDLNVYFQEQELRNEEHNGSHPKEEGRESLSTEKNKMENIYVNEKQIVYMEENCTTMVNNERDIKNLGRSEVIHSEKFSSVFNFTWKKSYMPLETALVENESRVIPGSQRGILFSHKRKLMPLTSTTTLSESTSSSAACVCKNSGANMPIPAALTPEFRHEFEDNQRNFQGIAQAIQSPSFGACGRNIFGEHQNDANYGRASEAHTQPTISEDQGVLPPQDLDFNNEIEVEFEQCEGSFLQLQGTAIHGNLPTDEMSSVYQLLESRIDWENLLGSQKPSEISKSTWPQEDGSQCFLKECSCIYSWTQKNHRDLLSPVVVPDLQVEITNIIQTRFTLSQEPLAMQGEVLVCPTPDTEEAEMNAVWKELESMADAPQFTCENTDSPSQGELFMDIWPEASELNRNLVISPPPESSAVHKACSPQPAATSKATQDDRPCPLAKLTAVHNKAPRGKDTRSKNSRRKQSLSSFKDKIIQRRNFRYPEPYGVTRKTSHHQSSEQFSSLSEGRIRTFSQSERYIRSVLNVLYSEASLCKSKRLSRKLNRAVLHLKKAHRRVHRSLQLITKVREKKRKSPLPKSYEVIRNSLWECCDLEGYNFLTERRYYSRHYWQKRKNDKREEKRSERLQVVGSRTSFPHHQGYSSSSSRDQGVRRSFSIEGPSTKASRSRVSTPRSTTLHRPHHSKSRGSASSRSSGKGPKRGADCQLSKGQQKAFPSHHSDDVNSREAPTGTHSTPPTMERNGEFCSDFGGNDLPLDTNKPNVGGNNETDSQENPDISISALKSGTEHCFNVDVSKTDQLRWPMGPPELEGYLPAEKSLALTRSLNPSMGSEHLVRASGDLAPWTSQEGESMFLDLSGISVENKEAEWWTLHSKRQPTVVGLAPCSPSLQQEEPQLQDDGEDSLDTIWGPCKNYLHRGDREEGSDTENTREGPVPPEKNKNCMNYAVDVLLNNISLENMRHSLSQKSRVKEKVKKRWKKQVEREQQGEKPVEHSSVLTELCEKSPIQIEDQGKQGQGLDSSVVTASWRKTTPSQLARTKEKEGGGQMEAEDGPTLSTITPQATMLGDPAIRKKVPQTRVRKMHSRIPEAEPTRQPPPTSELEARPEEDPPTLILKLSRILQKADEASTLKSLQEQIDTCQAVLPLFIEAFERKQKCSFKHILISRELLVEGNGWNNCKHHLHPQAVDSLVELQMMMETIQFIENKKGLLGSKPTFRSLLWYDASLYGELLRGNQGYQQQACLYPAFQDRLRYNAFSELQHYHDQLIKLLEVAKNKNKSYYVILKYKRQIKECEDVMKHSSNFNFSLSAPFTCGVNFGDNLEDLESLRKSTLELISNQDHFLRVQSCSGKQDHLWIIMEMISSKMHFIKNSESVGMKISLYGLEHIFFDAAKSLVWKERGLSVIKKDSPEKRKEELLRFNECALNKLQQIYETVEANSKAECASMGLLEETVDTPSKHCDCIDGEDKPSWENFRFSDTLFPLSDMCQVGEIINQAGSADLKQLQELTARCTGHLETLKKCFQILQEAAVDSVLITEDNVLDLVKKHRQESVILKPEAVEMYIEVVMLSETIHFLKNVMAKKLDKPRFRGMLWFDLSLLSELIENQEKIASFLFLKENAAGCLWEAVESAILELKSEVAVICEYPEGTNSSYALQLLTRELLELSEIRTFLEQATLPMATYVDLVPYTLTVNYGTTLSELEHNYELFAVLLKNLTLASQKDLGKMAHVMRVMKTIEYLKVSCAKMGWCELSLLTCQMFTNAEKALQWKKEQTRGDHETKPRMVTKKLGAAWRQLLSPSGLPHKGPTVSKKRAFTLALCESGQEQLKSPDLPNCKKPKVSPQSSDRPATEVEKGLEREREKVADEGGPLGLVPPPHLSQTGKWPHDVPVQGAPGPSCLLLLQGPTRDGLPGGTAGPQESAAGTRGRGLPRSLIKRSWSEGALPNPPGLPLQTSKASLGPCLRQGPDAPQAAPILAGANSHSEANLHSATATEGSTFLHPDHERFPGPGMVLPGHVAVVIQPSCLGASELLSTQNRLLGPPGPPQPGQRPEPPSQRAPGAPGVCPFSLQLPPQQPESGLGVFVPASGGCWNGHSQQNPPDPQVWGPSYTSFYPSYSWCVYHYCTSGGCSGGSSVTHTYQGMASYEGQPPPQAMARPPVYHFPSGPLGHSGPGDPQRSGFGQPLPMQGMGASHHGPLPCPAAWPPFVATTCASSQGLPQVSYPCQFSPGLFPGGTCTCGEYCEVRVPQPRVLGASSLREKRPLLESWQSSVLSRAGLQQGRSVPRGHGGEEWRRSAPALFQGWRREMGPRPSHPLCVYSKVGSPAELWT
ncbi:testis-expressed protein 15 isoform X2 [Monodelphis domestica]|uniref:testis-expressed protein 15 isoform X2 n=1 Tax=Monodelphis domestica TaxID=13616 RepID=UPI0024E26101|nr:testis-expressed protein 15 isoform X2 [Monodelphis domestica]